jgi:hypothetical protein
MALRKPLVIDAGQIEQLQAGDTLDAAVAGGDRVNLTNDEATPIVIGAPVYSDANDGVKKAQANSIAVSRVLGLVAQTSIAAAASGAVIINGPLTATTVQWDAITGDVGGLTFGEYYYLDPATSGRLVKVAPTTIGQYVVQVGRAFSTTELMVDIQQSILL